MQYNMKNNSKYLSSEIACCPNHLTKDAYKSSLLLLGDKATLHVRLLYKLGLYFAGKIT